MNVEKENTIKKNICEMLHIIEGDISKKDILKNLQTESGETIIIDTIVNAAKPTLMGSTQGVDGAIHSAIDEILAKKYGKQKMVPNFNEMIREELNVCGSANQILCSRGKAVITGGYGLCKYVIHVVGSLYDIRTGEGKLFTAKDKWLRDLGICSSSRIKILESCYFEIVRIFREHPDIKNVAIPIVSSGEYGFPFKMAVQIAIASLGNALLDWQREDSEEFNNKMEGIQNICFFIWNKSDDEVKEAKNILEEYKKIFSKHQQVVWQNSFQSQIQYFIEILKYDKNRGYFCIARLIRIILSFIRFFSLYTYVKDLGGGHKWQQRRLWVELIVVSKMALALTMGIIIMHCGGQQNYLPNIYITVIICYNLADTVTYLASLILMADIQRASANIIRSMLLLLFNYVEVSLDMAYLYFCQFRTRGVEFTEALEAGLLGSVPSNIELEMTLINDYLLFYGNAALKFFFITMVFGYLSGHMRQRRFRS